MKRKFTLIGSVAALATAFLGGWTQTTPAIDPAATFAPFVRWTNAIVAGDALALQGLYLASAPAQITVGKKELTASEDVNFWIGMKARRVKADILNDQFRGPDLRVIVSQIEVQTGTPSQGQTLYVSEAQSWMQLAGQWKLAAAQRTEAAYLQQPLNKDKKIYAANVDARAELKEAEDKASQRHKRVLVVFGANWCYDCHVLDLAFHRPDFAAVLAEYEVVHIDIGEDGKKNLDVAKDCQVPLDKGIPAVAVLDGSGKLIVSQRNGEFENARAMTPDALLEFLNKWKPAAR
ncbi:MAG: thioredoxin family protein [Candidatus Sulfotelmatobacter sp.]